MPVDRRPRTALTESVSRYLIERTAAGRKLTSLVHELGHRAAPTHWTAMLGAVTMACVLVLFATGVFLMFVYSPSSDPVRYQGSYPLLRGVEMSEALESTLRISFDVRGGLLIRQAHHWSALLLPAALIAQLLATFFTGAFRRPREWNWVLLFLLFIVALAGGWSGYALPDDMLSGTGLRIVEGIALGVPLVGTWAVGLLFGGAFPGEIIERLYPIHVAIVPALLILLIVLRVRGAFVHGPPQFAGPGRTEQNVVGVPILPVAATRAGALAAIVIGVVFSLSATTTISPIWLYGPSSPSDASAGSQPDWYTGFLDGVLRLVPPGWEFVWLDRTVSPAILVPLAVVTVFLLVVAVYPFIEAWITGDRREHHILDRPRNAATRTGIGAAGGVFSGTLWGAGSADLIANGFRVSVEGVIGLFQVTLFIGPIVAFSLIRRVCLALQRKDRELLLHGVETGRIVRLPGGEYIGPDDHRVGRRHRSTALGAESAQARRPRLTCHRSRRDPVIASDRDCRGRGGMGGSS